MDEVKDLEGQKVDDSGSQPTIEEIRKLRDENAKYRIRAKEKTEELEKLKLKSSEYDKMLENQKMEQGKYQELYDGMKKEVEDLRKYKDIADSYERDFSAQLEDELKTANELHAQLIKESNLSTLKKLEYLKKLKGETTQKANGIKSERPGNSLNVNINREEYRSIEGRKKLFEIKQKDPALFRQIINKE